MDAAPYQLPLTPEAREAMIAELEVLDETVTRRCEASLETFVESAWPVIEPHTKFVPGWHIGAICRHLEAVVAGEIRDLLILVPPRMTKSVCTSVCMTPWAWTKRPGLRFIFASYSGGLSMEHSVISRRVAESDWYRERWGMRYRLTTDQNVKSMWENSERGFRMATSVDGTVTGHGGDILVLDDPHNLRNINSDAERNAVHGFYKGVWHNRLNDMERGCRICIMQKGHPDDVATLLKARFGYEVLMLPNEYDPKRSRVTSIGWSDPRTQAGELLCERRVSQSETNKLKSLPREYQAQYQQDPMPEGGRMFEQSWFNILSEEPRDVEAWVRFWDVAGTEDGDGARTAGVKMGRYANGRFVISDIRKGRWTELNVDENMKQCAKLDGPDVAIREEQEPGSSGKAVVRARARSLAGYDYRGIPATGDKVTRARPLRSQAEAGNVDIVKRGNEKVVMEFLDELETFPYGLKDQVDAAAGALNVLTGARPADQDLLGAEPEDTSELARRVDALRTQLGMRAH